MLKGASLPPSVELGGWIARPGEMVTRSDPDELVAPNPDALGGGCTRYVFEPGMKLVLFLERRDGKLRFAGYPFARVSEDVRSDDALWVKAVRMYAAIAALPRARRRPAMIARRDALMRLSNAHAYALARDLDRTLKDPRHR